MLIAISILKGNESVHDVNHKVTIQTNSRGFTLIEVVLVLALGAVIFTLAFLAFRQVTSNRRDTQRRADLTRIMGALETNFINTGRYPDSSNVNIAAADLCTDTTSAVANSFLKFLQDHMCKNSEFLSPAGVNYSLYTWGNMTYTKDRIRYRRNVRCDGTSGTAYTYFVMIDLEKKTSICKDSG